jgi:hypothetical protein
MYYLLGSWILDMATEYPHVHFYGTDIAGTSSFTKNLHLRTITVTNMPRNRYLSTKYLPQELSVLPGKCPGTESVWQDLWFYSDEVRHALSHGAARYYSGFLEPRSQTLLISFCMSTRYFAVALRSYEWDAAYVSMYNQLKPGGYFQVLEPSILVSVRGTIRSKRERNVHNQQVTRMGHAPRCC